MRFRNYAIGALLAASFQTMALGSMIYERAQFLQTGKEVVLQSGMVDPRDLFRGHYVRLNLTIGRTTSKEVKVNGDPKDRSDVYLTLKPSSKNEFWIVDTLYSEKPKSTSMPFIKGNLRYITDGDGAESLANIKVYNIDFPIDRYFADKKRAKELENIRRNRNLGAVVALDEEGNSIVKGISIEGELIYSEPIW